MFLKKINPFKIIIFAAVAIIFLIPAGQAMAVEVKALVCGSGTTIQGVRVTFTKSDSSNTFCVTSPTGTCTPTLSAGTYTITVIPVTGYINNPSSASCPTISTYDTASSIYSLNVYLTSSAGGTTGGGTTGGTTGGIPGLTNKPLATIINDITLWLLGIVALIAVLFIIIGGVYYMTSGGDERRIETAKNIITYAILGLFVAAIAYATVLLVNKLVGT